MAHNSTIAKVFPSTAAASRLHAAVQRGFEEDWLGDVFSRAVMLGNGLTAILAGLLANTLVDTLDFGPVAPFDAAIVLLAVGGAIIWFTWPENYGGSTSNRTMKEQFLEAVDCIRSDQRVFLLGLMQVLHAPSSHCWNHMPAPHVMEAAVP